MFPVLQILLALALAMMASTWRHWFAHHPVGTPLATAAFIGMIAPLAAINMMILRGIVRRRGAVPGGWESIARAHFISTGVFRFVPLGLFVLICVIVGWPQYVAGSALAGTILLDEIAQMAPFLALLFLGWVIQHRIDCWITNRKRSLSRYLRFQLQQILLPLAPLVFVITLVDLLRATDLERHLTTFPFIMEAIVIGVLVLIYVLSGPLMRLFFRGERLPDGPLRERLEAFSERVGFRYRELLIWHTGLGLINAAIVGGVGRLRYVMFTEGMLATFSDDEIEAVLAHEIGHAKGRHLQLYFIFAITLIFLTKLARELAEWFLPSDLIRHEYFEFGLFAVVVVVYWRLVFGFVSRKFEREADYFGASSIGDHHRFIHTLEEVARKSGTLRTLPSWRHYSIAQRSDFLARAFEQPALAARFRRAVRSVKVVLVLTLVATLTIAMRHVGPQYRAGSRLREAITAIQEGRYAEARVPVLAALDDPAARPHFVRAVQWQPAWHGLERLVLVDVLRLTGDRARVRKEFEILIRELELLLRRDALDEARGRLRAIGAYLPVWQGIADAHAWRDRGRDFVFYLDAVRRVIRTLERRPKGPLGKRLR